MEYIGYGKYTRAREIVEFCKNMGYKKMGIAFCIGLNREAGIYAKFVRKNLLEAVSICCKNGGINKEDLGIDKEFYVNGENFEASCNPIAQAHFLNSQKTDFNVLIGLCVGHDSLFFKYSEAPCTVLVAKDRVLAHNPAGALYCRNSYYPNLWIRMYLLVKFDMIQGSQMF